MITLTTLGTTTGEVLITQSLVFLLRKLRPRWPRLGVTIATAEAVSGISGTLLTGWSGAQAMLWALNGLVVAAIV